MEAGGEGMGAERIESLLFDLDGTLVDTTELILACYRHTLSSETGGCPPDEEIIKGFGTPLLTQLGRLAGGDIDRLSRVYREFHDAHFDELIRAIPDVEETLRGLAERGYAMGLVTSKGRPGALMSLRRFGLEDYFRTVVTAEDTERHKPDPDPLCFGVRCLGASPRRTLYVGDSAHDLVAGRAAGLRVAAALWGPCGAHGLLSFRPDYALHSICDLLHLCPPLDSPV